MIHTKWVVVGLALLTLSGLMIFSVFTPLLGLAVCGGWGWAITYYCISAAKDELWRRKHR